MTPTCNERFTSFREETMGDPKIALAAYCLAVGLILAVAFHSPSPKQIIAASEPALRPVVDLK
jgi:hypothetical protein